MKDKKTALIICSLLFASVILIARSRNISLTDPGTDQATAAASVREILTIKKNFPSPLSIAHVMSARDTRLHVLAKFFFNEPNRIFTTGSMIILITLSKCFGDSYDCISFYSAIFSILTIFFGASVLLRTGKSHKNNWLRFVIAGLLIGTNFYLHYFSILGMHNIAIAAFIGCVFWVSYFFSPVIVAKKELNGKSIWTLALISFVSMHTYFTNPLLIPTTVGLYIITLPNLPLKERLSILIKYSLFLCLLLLPSLCFFIVIKLKNPVPVFAYANFTNSGVTDYFLQFFKRLELYVQSISASIGWPFFIGGIIGLFRMAGRDLNRMPLMAWLIHFLLWISIPGFTYNGSPTWHRTLPYVIPLLYIGATFLLVELAEISKDLIWARAIIIFAVVFHIYWNVPSMVSLQKLKNQMPSFHWSYFESEGKIRRAISTLSRDLKANQPILCWTYWGVHYFQALTDFPFDSYLPALTSMELRQKSGNLKDYARNTGLKVNKDEEIIFILDSDKPIGQELISNEVKPALDSVLGPEGLSWYESSNLELLSQSEKFVFPDSQLKLFKVRTLSKK